MSLQGEWALWIWSTLVPTSSSSAIWWFRDFPISLYVEATGSEELPKTCLLHDSLPSRRHTSGVPRKPGIRGKMHPENHMSFDKLCISKILKPDYSGLWTALNYSPEMSQAAQTHGICPLSPEQPQLSPGKGRGRDFPGHSWTSLSSHTCFFKDDSSEEPDLVLGPKTQGLSWQPFLKVSSGSLVNL